MTQINEYYITNGDSKLVKGIVELVKHVDPVILASKVNKLDFIDYAELEMHVGNKNIEGIYKILDIKAQIDTEESANPYQTNSSNTNPQDNEEGFRKGDQVEFIGTDGDRVTGELQEPATMGQAKVKTDAGSVNVSPEEMTLDLDSDDKEIQRLKQLSGIEEATPSCGVSSGAITSAAFAGVTKSPNQIAQANHIKKKPGPKAKKHKK